MKKLFSLLLLICSTFCYAAIDTKTISYSILSDAREYVVCTPDNYSSDQSYALMVFLHELKGQIHNHEQMAQDFANRYNWIIAMPQSKSYFDVDASMFGSSMPEGFENILDIPAWNSGMKGSTLKNAINGLLEANISNKWILAAAKVYVAEEVYRWENANDEEFIIDMLEEVKSDYAVAPDSIFVAGMSMGGFMTNRIMINQGQYFNAAVAISGVIGDALMDEQPQHGTHPRIMYIHGTNDNIVGYDGYASIYGVSAQMGLSAEQTVEYWRQYNDCDSVSQPVYYYPNTVNDGLTFERYMYKNGIDDSEVAFIKVNNGRHEWYDTSAGKDVDYLEEIYKFCTHTIEQPQQPTNIDILGGDIDTLTPQKRLINGHLYIVIGTRQYDILGR